MSQDADADVDMFFDFMSRYAKPALKAFIISMIFATAVFASTSSVWRAIGIGFMSFVIASCSTWRRTLEPISLCVFLGLIVYICLDYSTIKALLPPR